MNRSDIDSLTSSIREMLLSSADDRIYFPTRVRYLNAIMGKLSALDKGRRHCILALNSSVARQSLLGHRGYNFGPFFHAFRDRVGFGDYVFRVYCLSPVEKIDLVKQLEGVKDAIERNDMQNVANICKVQPEQFNCVYILPMKNNDVDGVFDGIYRDIIQGNNENISQCVDYFVENADLNGGIFYYEHHDYDPQHTQGCGYKYEPRSTTAEAVNMLTEYRGIVTKCSSVWDPSLLSEVVPETYNIGILVALPVEFDAVKNQLDQDSIGVVDVGASVSFFRGTTKARDGGKIAIVIAQLPGAGNIGSTLATSLLIQRYGVHTLFHVGIAGGLRGEVNLGDVVVGGSVIYTERKKIYEKSVSPEMRVLECRFSELAAIHNRDRYRSRVKAEPPFGADVTKCKAIFDGSIMSGESVISDPDILKTIKTRVHRKLIAVENEAAGMYTAASSINPSKTRYITIKGISDYSDSEKSDDWHEYAAAASAAYAFEAIRVLGQNL